jgi:putative NADH-flavin reductase
MKIGIIGATGFVGNAIYKEALERGHEIVAVSRTRRVEEHPKVKIHQETIYNEKALEKVLKDVDVIISAYNPGYFHVDLHNRYIQGYDLLVNLSKKLDKKLIMVLSATSLKLPSGAAMEEDLSYPAVLLKYMSGAKAVYEKYVNDMSFKWTMVSPAAILINGKKTKKYVMDTDTIVLDAYGDSSKVSVQDLADAILNEVESPKYLNKRFTIGYK